MEYILPDTLIISTGAIVTAIFLLLTTTAGAVTAYRKIMSEIHGLRQDVTEMKRRNVVADHETDIVKVEQAQQKTTMAVMAAQVTGIDRSITEMKTDQRETVQLLRELLKGK